eukprot:GABW01001357.1.p1 GENE.GABW01001357.1~~GABW01001357.1.p1  ORF type:complete len:65 (+),score=18.74 GABW01001357.1:111-305(+)
MLRLANYSHWKAITTGKPPSVGGIPHDTYGMTTRSVHQYVVCSAQKLGVAEGQHHQVPDWWSRW